jgi:AraC-like DNA-binding protein
LKANGIAEKIGNNKFLAMGYSNLTQGALDERNYQEVLSYGQKVLDLLRLQPFPVLKIKVDSMMCVAYKETGNYPAAFSCLESFVREKEKLVSERQGQQLNQLVLELQVREKNLTIANQQLEITREQQKQQVLTLIIVIILLLVIGQFFYIVKSRKFRNELFRKEKDLEQQTKEIRAWMEWKQSKDLETIKLLNKNTESNPAMDETKGLHAQNILFSELRDVFDKQKLFLDPELNLKTVIKVLGTNQKYLYQAISENSDNNFRSFLNRYRVDEAKRVIEKKIQSNEDLNLSDLYASVGFNSPVSFYRAFKSVTGLTPKDYVVECRNEMFKSPHPKSLS